MKKLMLLLTLLAFTITSYAQELTDEERKAAIDYLKSTQQDLKKSFAGLSEAQLNFKSSPEAWSIAECIEHLAISETKIWGTVQLSLQEKADPSRRSEVKMSDDDIKKIITDRSNKVKTREDFVPSSKFNSIEGSVNEFDTNREKNIAFVNDTHEDLRNHYFTFPFGTLDTYQVILFMAGHTSRHTLQIEEVKADANFPKSDDQKKDNTKKTAKSRRS
jgi:hypothetical protein